MGKRRQKIYIDTSVAGGYFDKEFAVVTKEFLSQAKKNNQTLLISSLLEEELSFAPAKVIKVIRKLKAGYVKRINHTPEAEA